MVVSALRSGEGLSVDLLIEMSGVLSETTYNFKALFEMLLLKLLRRRDAHIVFCPNANITQPYYLTFYQLRTFYTIDLLQNSKTQVGDYEILKIKYKTLCESTL